jgi:hypothetical protein
MSVAVTFFQEASELVVASAIFPQVYSTVLPPLDPLFIDLESSYSEAVPGPQNGELRLQFQTRSEASDAFGSNAGTQSVVTVDATILRHIRDRYDEQRYWLGMTRSQERLTDGTSWRALSTVFDIVSAPTVPSSPERRGNILQYTMTVTCQLNADV